MAASLRWSDLSLPPESRWVTVNQGSLLCSKHRSSNSSSPIHVFRPRLLSVYSSHNNYTADPHSSQAPALVFPDLLPSMDYFNWGCPLSRGCRVWGACREQAGRLHPATLYSKLSGGPALWGADPRSALWTSLSQKPALLSFVPRSGDCTLTLDVNTYYLCTWLWDLYP